MQKLGKELRPFMKKVANIGQLCGFDGCGHAAYIRGLCHAHARQKAKGDELYPLGDRSVQRRKLQEHWAAQPERRKAQAAVARRNFGIDRNEHWNLNNSASKLKVYKEGRGGPKDPRTCANCQVEFMPKSGPQIYCTVECRRKVRQALRYGITIEELAAIRVRQNNRCGICLQEVELDIDHDHVTGKVRGFLCQTCNTGLGKMKDSVDTLRRAIAYLEG